MIEAENNYKNIFYEGPIDPGFIALIISKHQKQREIGAHSLFLGQVRADKIADQVVAAIEFSSYEHLALKIMSQIREETIQKFGLSCLHVYHSTGRVAAGEICLFVFAASAHRSAAVTACSETVEEVKNKLPIWGKEWTDCNYFRWKKQNNPAFESGLLTQTD